MLSALLILILATSGLHAEQDTAAEKGAPQALSPISVTGEAPAAGDQLGEAYTGGQTAGSARIGVLGERDTADIPFSVIGFTEELIENQQADTLGDVVRNDAAVQASFGFGNFAETYTIRGLQLFGEDISLGGLYGVLPRQVVTTNLAERVEIFKGSNAFANGVPPAGSGVGGAINIEPKRAESGQRTELRFGYASDSFFEAAVDAGQRFGEGDQFGVRLNLQYGDGDTAIDDEERKSTAASLALDYRSERARVSLDAGYQEQNIDNGRAVLNLGPDLTRVPEPPDAETNYAASYVFSDLETVFGMVRGEYDLSDAWTVYSAIGANETDELGEYASPTVINTNGDATIGRLGVPYEASSFAGQGGIRGEFLTGPVSHSFNLGYSGYYRRTGSAFTFAAAQPTNIYNPADLDFPPTIGSGGNLDNPNVSDRTRADGVALSDTVGLLQDRLLITLGARYQDVEVINYNNDGVFTNELQDDRISPVYGIVFKPWQRVSLYANHIEALQPGQQAPTIAANAGQTIGIAKTEQNEVGAKYNTRAFGVTASVYEIEQPNAIIDADTNIFGYSGEQRNRGVELSLYGAPLDGLRVLSSATWIDAKLTQTQDGEFDGNTAVGIPEYRVVLGGDWDLPDSDRWTAIGRVIHSGEQYANQANTLEIDDWTRVDLGLRYRMPVGERNLVWRGAVENIAGEEYWESAIGGYLVQGRPRVYKLSASYQF